MLTTGKGKIFLTKDEHFKGGNEKIRRVMQSGYNPENNSFAVNRISSTGDIKLNRQHVPILQKESYIDTEVHVKKKKSGLFLKEDLIETSSTINPYDYKKVFKSIGKKQSNDAKVKKYK